MNKVVFKKVYKKAGFYAFLVALAFFRAIATYVFIVPNSFAPGGVGGIASTLYNVVLIYDARLAATWFNPAFTIFIFNLPLVILALKKLDKAFAINSALCVLGYSGFMALFSLVDFPVFKTSGYESGVTLLAAIAGGVISGITLGVMLMVNTSAGGTDIMGKLANKRNPDINTQWQIFIFDAVVAVFSGVIGLLNIKGQDTNTIFLNVATPIFYSFIALFVNSQMADFVTEGVDSGLVFNIVTSKTAEISEAIITKLHRGATILRGEGIFTGTERNIIVCVVKRRQAAYFKKLMKSIDPDTFIYVTKTKEVTGFGFSGKEKK